MPPQAEWLAAWNEGVHREYWQLGTDSRQSPAPEPTPQIWGVYADSAKLGVSAGFGTDPADIHSFETTIRSLARMPGSLDVRPEAYQFDGAGTHVRQIPQVNLFAGNEPLALYAVPDEAAPVTFTEPAHRGHPANQSATTPDGAQWIGLTLNADQRLNGWARAETLLTSNGRPFRA